MPAAVVLQEAAEKLVSMRRWTAGLRYAALACFLLSLIGGFVVNMAWLLWASLVGMAFAFALMQVAAIRLMLFRCPRCHRLFQSWHRPWFRSDCQSCGLQLLALHSAASTGGSGEAA